MLKLECFKYGTSLDLNTGYYHSEFDTKAKELCTIVLPWGNMNTKDYTWDYATVLTSFKRKCQI